MRKLWDLLRNKIGTKNLICGILGMTSEMPGTTNQMNHAVTMDQAEQMNPGIQKNSAQATKKWAESHLNDLILVADEVLEREGMDYQADAHVTKCCFPEKKYGDMTFPQGEYEALRITLGEAAGHNWWCVLYPNLCFLDKTCAVVSDEGKEDLKGVLTDEEYQLLTDNKELKMKWFFFGD